MKKRILSYLVVITMVFALLSVFSFTANAANISATTNKYTYIRMAPYWTAEVVDNLTSGYSITILEREYTYLYIQYTKDGVTKRGYMPKADTSATGYSWCQHGEYNNGYNSTSYAQTVYYRPGGASCGTIDANEGEVANKPLLVLRVESGYAFIQYVTNTSNDGSAHVLFKRGWVPTSVIAYSHATFPTGLSENKLYYLKNVATGKYLDLQSYSAGNVDGGNIHIWDFHGSYNQEWSFKKVTSGGSTYVKLVTNQGTQNRVIRIAEKTAVVGNSAELYTQTSPSKEQEFVLEKKVNSQTGNTYYLIKARCSGNFMVLGVNPSDSGTGGEVYLRYPDGSDYNKWVLEPAYIAGTNYIVKDDKISSSIANGISTGFDLSEIRDNPPLNFKTYCQQVINSWNYPNTKIVISEDDESLNKVKLKEYYWNIILDDPYGQANYEAGINAFTITLYYGNMVEDFSDEQIPSVFKSVFAHEIGHALGLAHRETANRGDTLMYPLRDRTAIIAPTKIDIAAVKKNYCTK